MKLICILLTIIRLISVPIIAVLFFQYKWAAFFVFIFASITDYLDGKLARAYNATSEIGKIMDPIVDKILVITMLVLLIIDTPNIIIPSMIIIWREIIINYIRLNQKIDSSMLSKIKTTFQMLAIGMLMLPKQSYVNISKLGLLTLWIAALLALVTGILYFMKSEKNYSE